MTADAVGGVWTYALDLTAALAPLGVEVVLATMGPRPTAAQLHAAAALPNVRVECSDFALEWMENPWADVARAGDWLLELEARTTPDLVHLNGYVHGALPFRAPLLVVGHSCVLSWADAVPGAIPGDILAAYSAHVTPGIRAADMVVAPTRAMRDALQHHYGPLARTQVVPNGRRPGVFAPARKEPFIFTAGRLWDPAKNIHALCAVAATLPWPTGVAGPGGVTPEGERTAMPGMRSLGVLEESVLADWLGRASIVALPARYEPFGLLALEAALSGCALVLGDIPSLREVWGDAAHFVHPDDTEALAATLSRLIASPRLLTMRAEAARQRAQHYSLDRMRDGYLEACRSASAHHHTTTGVLTCAS